jgi:hypothetical protein
MVISFVDVFRTAKGAWDAGKVDWLGAFGHFHPGA